MSLKSIELDPGYLVTRVTVMGTGFGVVGVVVSKDFLVFVGHVVLKSVGVPARVRGIFDGEQLDAGAVLGIDLDVPI